MARSLLYWVTLVQFLLEKCRYSETIFCAMRENILDHRKIEHRNKIEKDPNKVRDGH